MLKSPAVIIVLSLFLAVFNSWPAFFFLKIGLFDTDSVWFSLATAISAFLLMFLLPSFLIKYAFKEKLSDFGLNIPNIKETLKLSLTILLIFLPIIFFLSGQKSFEDYYFINGQLNIFFLLTSAFASLFYYFSEEFLFRGFLFFGLWNRLKIHSFWIISLLFSFLHLSKAKGEFIFAFFFSLAACYLSLKTKSFIPAVLVHFILALTLNILVYYLHTFVSFA